MAIPGPAVRSIPSASARAGERLQAALETMFFTLLLGFAAQVKVPLPPDGVPQTLQTLVVLLAALRLGPGLGAMSMALYALVGVLGLPVFSDGQSGPAVLVAQTGGYIIGFIICQPVVHAIVRRGDGSIRGWLALVVAMAAAHAVIFAVGVPWLGVVRQYSAWRAIHGGLLPFIPGTIVKTLAAALIGRYVAPRSTSRLW